MSLEGGREGGEVRVGEGTDGTEGGGRERRVREGRGGGRREGRDDLYIF